jgi:beta-aspartyl-peptidase (threonine type)
MTQPLSNRETYSDIVLAVHGGAGVLSEEVISQADQEQYFFHLAAALDAGYKSLQRTQSALDGVETAVRYLEDCPLFNAGKGAVLNENGEAELDSAIMDGRTRAAGAIACVKRVRNPITCARAVMERTEHVLLAGEGADEFAVEAGLEIVDPHYFWTERRSKELEKLHQQLHKERQVPQVHAPNSPTVSKYGTVGAVALDAEGNLAAATSTGGMLNKKFGRIGDSPVLGAGTYADNEAAAISCTGHGEFFIRWVAAYEVCALMKYKKLSLSDAAHQVINETLANVKGSGGLIALDAQGNCALPFNSEGMFRGCVTRSGEIKVAIFRQ